MKRPERLLVSACLAIVAGTVWAAETSAEKIVLAQDLVNVRASNKVAAAVWTHRPDSYTLQVVLGQFYQRLKAPPVAAPAPITSQETGDINRSSFFIGNTIANLRCADPNFGGRTLTLIDGRRMVPGGSSQPAIPPSEPIMVSARPAATPEDPPRIQVWLLRADGTQITPIAVSNEPPAAKGCSSGSMTNEILYRFPSTESAQAAAVAISVDDQYYIEKLRPLH